MHLLCKAGGSVVHGPSVLGRPGDRATQPRGGAPGPVRVGQKRAADEDGVGTPVLDDLVGLVGVVDPADRRDERARAGPDAVGERDLVARVDGDGDAGDQPPGGHVDQVDAALDQAGYQRDRVCEREAGATGVVLEPVGGLLDGLQELFEILASCQDM